MMSVTHPDLCRRVAVRHSLGLIAVCSAAPLVGATHWAFAVDSLPLNLYMLYLSVRYHDYSSLLVVDWYLFTDFIRKLTASQAGTCFDTP